MGAISIDADVQRDLQSSNDHRLNDALQGRYVYLLAKLHTYPPGSNAYLHTISTERTEQSQVEEQRLNLSVSYSMLPNSSDQRSQ